MKTEQELAQWIWELQRALPDFLEDLIPRSIRCPWCDARFNGGWHEEDCPLRKIDQTMRRKP